MKVTFGQGATIQKIPVRARVGETSFLPKWDDMKHLVSSGPASSEFGISADIVHDDQAPRRTRIPLHPLNLPPDFTQNILKFAEKLNISDGSRFSPDLADPLQNQIIALALFVEPPGTPMQNFHEDVNGFRLFPVWNAMCALKVPHDQKADLYTTVAQSLFSSTSFDAQDKQSGSIIFWDGAWPHRGTGNASTELCVQIHVVFAASWVLRPLRRVRPLLDRCIQGAIASATPTDFVEKFFSDFPALASLELRDHLTVLQVYHLRAELAREYEGGLLRGRNGFYEHGDAFDRAMFDLYMSRRGPFRSKDLFNKFTWREERSILENPSREYEMALRAATLQRWKYWHSRVRDSDPGPEGAWPMWKCRVTEQVFPQSELGFWFCRSVVPG